MAKCLRCGAGNEWIEGNVPNEPPPSRASRGEGLWKALANREKRRANYLLNQLARIAAIAAKAGAK